MKAHRYHARRPRAKTQIAATKPCDPAADPDAISASGRSDYPNQVNNVLVFPSIFRGALDARATRIDEEMKLAACRAIAVAAPEACHG